MTKIRTFRNKRNPNKFIEVHNDGHYHNSVKQYMYWETNVITGERLLKPVKNLLGDRKLHRLRKADLKSLLEDYEELSMTSNVKMCDRSCAECVKLGVACWTFKNARVLFKEH